MQVIEISSYGAPGVLRLAERPMPVAGAGELCIRVSASGVNRPDVLQRAGHYPAPAGASDIPGLEVAGVVVEGDASAMQAAGLQMGDPVCALLAGGGYAQFCIAPVAQCLPLPAGWSLVEAASLPETLFTVWSNLVDRAQLVAGETLLVQGGSSGIGVMAIQLAKALGVTVFATAGSDAKCEAVRALGADHAINYRTHDFQAEIRQLTRGRGVDVVLDMVAGDYVAREMACLAEDGRLVIIAVQGGKQSQMDAGLLMQKRLTVTGSTLRVRPVSFKAAIAQACRARVWPLLETRKIKPVIHRVFAAVDATQASGSGAALAHTLMESHQHVGKLVLNWGSA
ncbi:MAG: NAD(P)H-quinone oxidoreductase [Rhodoferax sp.]|nr:NAD(P)H-quinone oxidoreductase [Rhodoferax sp.]